VVPVLASYMIQARRAITSRGWCASCRPPTTVCWHRPWPNSRRFIIGALLALPAAGAFFLLGKAFMPTMDEGDIIMQLEKLPSIGLDQTIAIDSRVQQAILEKVPEVKAIVARAGSDELGLDPMGLNQTDTFMVLQPRDDLAQPDPAWLADQLRAVMVDFPGIGISFTQPIDMRVSEMLTGVRGDLAIKVFGPDLATLNRLAGEIEGCGKEGVPGAEDTFTLRNDGVQYLKIAVDRLAAGRFGLNVDDIQNDLKRCSKAAMSAP
jgi:cobalt-zinc-cadmium resistance protein CzcA